jgi:hypothetical protein
MPRVCHSSFAQSFPCKIRAAHHDHGTRSNLPPIVRLLADRDYAITDAEVRKGNAVSLGEILRSRWNPAKRSAVADGNCDRLALVWFEGNLAGLGIQRGDFADHLAGGGCLCGLRLARSAPGKHRGGKRYGC